MFEELKIVASGVAIVTGAVFTIPIALIVGVNVAQKIGVVQCIAPQVQNTK